MSTPIGNENHYNVFIFFSLFLYNLSVLKGWDHNRNAAALLFCVTPTIALYFQVYSDSGREFSFNNINLCESNVAQIIELIFCDSDR